jgi:hypothetical protein
MYENWHFENWLKKISQNFETFVGSLKDGREKKNRGVLTRPFKN